MTTVLDSNDKPTVLPDGIELPEPDMRVAWRAVHPDLRSSNGFRWPWPGQWAACDPGGAEFSGGACPTLPGDGLCLARSWRGAAAGGIPAVTCLLVAYRPGDVLGSDSDKLRVSGGLVLDVFDAPALLRDGFGAGANLRWADLRWSNLRGSNLRWADLRWSNLRWADLYGSDLYGADLRGVNLCGVNLCWSDLRGSDLYGADLYGAYHDQWTRWPDGFTPPEATR